MYNRSYMEEQLWKYIDGQCTPEESASIKKLIGNDIHWKQCHDELLGLHTLLQREQPDQPSLRFTQNVMEQVSTLSMAKATRTYINKKIVWGIAAFFAIVIISFMFIGLSQTNSTATANSQQLIDLGELRELKPDWHLSISHSYLNIIIMINMIAGLILLDRIFNKRKRINHTT